MITLPLALLTAFGFINNKVCF